MNYSFEVNFGEECKHIEISYITLRFFDTLHAELVRDFGNFSYFEYCDEDKDRISVRSDEDLSLFIDTLQNDTLNTIWLVKKDEEDVSIPVILPQDLQKIEFINNGQFGTVYKSLHLPSDKILAVKSVELSEHHDEKKLVLREISVLKKCMPCDYIVQLIGALMDVNMLMICFEYMDLGSIKAYLPLPLDVHQHVSKCVFSGLSHLWNNNIMHRDMKPANILVNSAGYIKISDFGVSKHVEHSVARTFVGTKAYMAPERLNGGIYKVESDIWSFGLTIWEMVSEKFPLEDLMGTCTSYSVFRSLSMNGTMFKPKLAFESALSYLIQNCVSIDPCSRWNQKEIEMCEYLGNITHIDRDMLHDYFNKFKK